MLRRQKRCGNVTLGLPFQGMIDLQNSLQCLSPKSSGFLWVLQEQAEEEEAAWPLAAELLQQTSLAGGGELLCVQQLLIKGLFQPDTLLLTVQVPAMSLSICYPSLSSFLLFF